MKKHSFSHLLGISLLAAAVAFPVVADAKGGGGGGGRGGGGGGGRAASSGARAGATSGARAAAAASRSSIAIARAASTRGATAAAHSSHLGSSFKGGASMGGSKIGGGGKMGGGVNHYSAIRSSEPAFRSYSSGTYHSSSYYYPYYTHRGHYTTKPQTTTEDGKVQLAADDVEISVSPACVFMKASSSPEVRALSSDALNDKIDDVVNSDEFKSGNMPADINPVARQLWNAALACQ